MADSGRMKPAAGESPSCGRRKGESPGSSSSSSSPGSSRRKPPQSPGSRSKQPANNNGHSFRKVTLTKPTFCHHCSDFIWGLVGYVCEVCNLMSHEKCLKHVRTVCSCMAPTLVRVPVAHCFGPAGQKKRFCCVCRKNLEGTAALRCEVCELHVHSDCAPFSCSDCRLCHQDGGQDYDMYHHHWREGNMASGARCEVCRRACSSSDVLSGMRCEWCGITAHASCYIIISPECSLGRLRSMILHPSCVRVCSRNFSKMHCYRISETSQQCELDNLDDVDVQSPVASKENQSSGSSDTGKQTLKVFDGDDAVKRNQFRLVSIPRITKNEEVVEAALRAFYIPDEPQDYELQIHAQQGLLTDDIINRNGTPDNKAVFKDSQPEAWLLRAKPREVELLKIYAGWLKLGVAYISITVGKSSTVDSVIKEVLTQLGKEDENPADFNLVEVFMSSKQVQRQVLTGQELLLEKLREIRKVSLRQMNQTRFYVVESRNRVVQVDLLLGGFPLQLSTEEYTQLLQQHLAIKSHLVTITHVYAGQGAVALQISCFSEAERIYMLAKDTNVNGKQLTSLVIPEIMQSKLAKGSCPLLVFVNPKSGGLKGREILYGFRKLLNPHQVFELTSGGPLPGLHTFREVPHFRMLVCGGDGTVGWVLGVLESIRHKLSCPEPAIGIIPLGTGNDLARVLRWGAGYSGEDHYSILVSVDEAEEVEMDRWTILFDAQEMTEDGKQNGFLEPPKIVQMNNYFGLGIDAELSLDFHHAREEEPGKFNSRFHNKGVYVKVGLQKLSHTRNLHKDLRLQVDKQDIELPSIEGLIFLNIPSWGSGADLWGSDSDARFGKPRIDDGMLEVVGVTGVVHMGQVQSGLRSGIRIAQGSYIRIIVTKPIPVQVDGEPWIQAPGQIIISAAGPKVRMLKKSKVKPKKQSSSLREGRAESPVPGEGAN
ncbi:diacylglycerol kinase theta isoform X1 [Colossoma macropomum]|uniref:diacylglycerol kinase theta isoform X1 n=2 Tax=Colossoma macropomum TaxID=42526 RepID=UPI0018643156|nr:diacylglycerol kinase theta isoform X1 [Colossoma macropomum]